MTTNGAALTNSRVRKFLAENSISLLVSLDGPADIHDAHRRSKSGAPTQATIMAGLKALLCEYPAYYSRNVAFNSVLVDPRGMPRILRFFRESSIYQECRKDYRITPVQPYEDENGNKPEYLPAPPLGTSDGDNPWSVAHDAFIENRRREADPDDLLIWLDSGMHARLAQRPMTRIPDAIQPQGYCIPGARKLFASVDGELHMCEKMDRSLPIGTLRDGFDYKAIQSILTQLHEWWTADCSHCVAQRFCGVCPIIVHDGEGFSREMFEDNCVGFKRKFEDTLKDFILLCEENSDYYKRQKNITIS
jgi:uncharacterized protein